MNFALLLDEWIATVTTSGKYEEWLNLVRDYKRCDLVVGFFCIEDTMVWI